MGQQVADAAVGIAGQVFKVPLTSDVRPSPNSCHFPPIASALPKRIGLQRLSLLARSALCLKAGSPCRFQAGLVFHFLLSLAVFSSVPNPTLRLRLVTRRWQL